MIRDFQRAIGDLLTPRFLLLSLLPLVVVLPLIVMAVASLSGGVADLWQGGSVDNNWLADWVSTWPWVGGIADYAWVRGLLGLVGAVAGWLLVVLGALFLAVAVVGLLTPHIVGEVRRRHYPGVPAVEGAGVVAYLLFLLKSLAVFVGLGLLVLPLLFLPGVNLLVINLPFFYWFHRLLSWDVLEAACPGDAQPGSGQPATLSLASRTVVLYLLSLVPLLGLLLQVFFVLVLSHHVLQHASRAAGGERVAVPHAS